jgi:hypothetical protein
MDTEVKNLTSPRCQARPALVYAHLSRKEIDPKLSTLVQLATSPFSGTYPSYRE